MSNSLGINVTGFPELMEKVKQLANDKDKKREVLLIMRQVAKPVLLAAEFAAPLKKDWKMHIARGKKISPGNLKKSIGFITSKAQNPTVLVGPRAKRNFDGWYGHMVHDGHDIYRNDKNASKVLKSGRKKSVLARVTHKRKGNAVGRVQGIPFMDIAFAQTKGAATADAQDKMTKFVQRRINKLSS